MTEALIFKKSIFCFKYILSECKY